MRCRRLVIVASDFEAARAAALNLETGLVVIIVGIASDWHQVIYHLPLRLSHLIISLRQLRLLLLERKESFQEVGLTGVDADEIVNVVRFVSDYGAVAVYLLLESADYFLDIKL